MRGLSGAHFQAIDADGNVVASTLGPVRVQTVSEHLPVSASIENLTEFPSIELEGTPYFVAEVNCDRSAGAAWLYVLYPEQDWQRAQWDAAWPPLAVGAATAVLMVLIAVGLASRLGRRIAAVRLLFSRLADGEFAHAPLGPLDDEIRDLALASNRLSDQLSTMRDQISRTERLRLLAQLAGGLAHQLRNAVTGARMAIQLHRRRCPQHGSDESLDVALRQLALTEEHVKGLLSLGKPRRRELAPANVCLLLEEIVSLVNPVCQHARVELRCDAPVDHADIQVAYGDDLKAAILNLVLNGIEAAGVGGRVVLSAACDEDAIAIEVRDSGAGPPPEVRDSLLEPFVSSKPEGVGLGLALAEMAAAAHGGTLSWNRENGQTVFTIRVPVYCEPTVRSEVEPIAHFETQLGLHQGATVR
jgi:signal transduction histidine kinase